MEKNEDNVRLFENAMNNVIFKFLVSEYYSQNMNPFQILRALSKILAFKISKFLKIKYILLFLSILKKLTISKSIFDSCISLIINEYIGDIITRKADYVIIIQMIIFLVQIGEVDFALSKLQIYSYDTRFMNYGELLFYRAIILYSTDKNIDYKNIVSLLDKSLMLIKNQAFLYCEWVIRFIINKNLTSELEIISKNDKIREYITHNTKLSNFLNAFNDVDYIDILKKIQHISEELEINFIDFSIALKFIELVNNYYDENYQRSKLSLINKILNLNQKYFIIFIKFLFTHLLYDYKNENLQNILISILKELKVNLENNSENLNQDNKEAIKNIIMENSKYIVDLLIKDKIYKKILEMKKNPKNIIEKIFKYSRKLITATNYDNLFITIEKILEITDISYGLLYGLKFTHYYSLKADPTLLKSDEQYLINFLNNLNSIKLTKVN